MPRILTAWGVVLTLAVLGAGCDRTPPPPPGPAPTPTPRLPVHIVLFVYPAPSVTGACAVVAVPQHADVGRSDDLVWDVVNDACEKAGEITIRFASPDVVDLEPGDRKQKKGKVKAEAPYGKHKYSVALASGFVEDPEIEIQR